MSDSQDPVETPEEQPEENPVEGADDNAKADEQPEEEAPAKEEESKAPVQEKKAGKRRAKAPAKRVAKSSPKRAPAKASAKSSSPMAASKKGTPRGRGAKSIHKKRSRSRGRITCLADAPIWKEITERDAKQDARKPQRAVKLERMQHLHSCFLNTEQTDLNPQQLVTLLERFESQDEKAHCAFLSTLLMKNEEEARGTELWVEGGLEARIARHCAGILRSFDMQTEVEDHKNFCAEQDSKAAEHLREAKQHMKTSKKKQDSAIGQQIISNLESALTFHESSLQQATTAREKLMSAIELNEELQNFFNNLEEVFGPAMNTLPDEGKELLKLAIERPLTIIQENLPASQQNVEEAESLTEHTKGTHEEAADLLSHYEPPMTAEEKREKMLARKAKADQAYLNRMSKTGPPSDAKKNQSPRTAAAKK